MRLKRRLLLSQKIKMGKPRAVDLVACKNGRKLAFEVETGSNSLDQMVQNLCKCISSGYDRVYLVPTNQKALKRLSELKGNKYGYLPRN